MAVWLSHSLSLHAHRLYNLIFTHQRDRGQKICRPASKNERRDDSERSSDISGDFQGKMGPKEAGKTIYLQHHLNFHLPHHMILGRRPPEIVFSEMM